jgi:ATP-dependent RNA helicase DbpA
VLRHCPRERQTLLFSATYPEGIAKLAAQFLRTPVTVKVEAQHGSGQIEQRWYEVGERDRLPTVARLLDHFRPASTLAFCNTKARCRELAQLLQAQGYSALALHGELEQRDRDQVLVRFANGSCSVLVATDVAARGLDVAGVQAVINVDVTPDPETHVHRIGRTARAGARGVAVSFVTAGSEAHMRLIEKRQGLRLPREQVAGFEPAEVEPPVPPDAGVGGIKGRRPSKKDKLRAAAAKSRPD